MLIRYQMPIRVGLILFILATALAGCNREDQVSDIRQYMDQLKKANEVNEVASNNQAPTTLPVPASYKKTHVRAPFESGLSSAAAAGDTQTNPLQAFPLSILRFVGTSMEDNVATAYILTPNNMIFQVRKGDAIGEHYGKIINISSGSLEVEEPADKDNNESRVIVLQLKDANG